MRKATEKGFAGTIDVEQALVAEVFNFGRAAAEYRAAEDAIFGHKRTDVGVDPEVSRWRA